MHECDRGEVAPYIKAQSKAKLTLWSNTMQQGRLLLTTKQQSESECQRQHMAGGGWSTRSPESRVRLAVCGDDR